MVSYRSRVGGLHAQNHGRPSRGRARYNRADNDASPAKTIEAGCLAALDHARGAVQGANAVGVFDHCSPACPLCFSTLRGGAPATTTALHAAVDARPASAGTVSPWTIAPGAAARPDETLRGVGAMSSAGAPRHRRDVRWVSTRREPRPCRPDRRDACSCGGPSAGRRRVTAQRARRGIAARPTSGAPTPRAGPGRRSCCRTCAGRSSSSSRGGRGPGPCPGRGPGPAAVVAAPPRPPRGPSAPCSWSQSLGRPCSPCLRAGIESFVRVDQRAHRSAYAKAVLTGDGSSLRARSPWSAGPRRPAAPS